MTRLGSFALVLCAALCAGHLHAGLVDRYFAGKKDDELVKEFYKRLPDHLRNMISTKNPPRALLTVNKRTTVFAELKQVQGKGETNIWVELLKSNWFTNAAGFAWAPGEAQFYFKNSDIPAATIAGWFDGRTAAPSDIVLLAVFLAKNNELGLANMRLTEMAEEHKDMRSDVEAWLCERNKWTLPEGGLQLLAVRDIVSGQGGVLLMTEEAKAAHLAKLDAKAPEMLDMLAAARGDASGELGKRKNAPTERLDELKNRCERFSDCFRGTAFLENAEKVQKLENLKKSLEADLEIIKSMADGAEGIIKQDPVKAASTFETLSKADPFNTTWKSRLAYCWFLDGNLLMGGGCSNPKSMKKAADLYEALAKEFPLNGNLNLFAGACKYAAGDRDSAKKYLEKAEKLLDPQSSDYRFLQDLLKNLK
ncbi:hypothetical protein EDM80_04465 [bacterium]|nr:MAG: hypothetical protein EDM80_04465 [bacterium]RIK65374.1 MAG: hypothetical protein DCC64_01675 [Planctomycetota bacterium]